VVQLNEAAVRSAARQRLQPDRARARKQVQPSAAGRQHARAPARRRHHVEHRAAHLRPAHPACRAPVSASARRARAPPGAHALGQLCTSAHSLPPCPAGARKRPWRAAGEQGAPSQRRQAPQHHALGGEGRAAPSPSWAAWFRRARTGAACRPRRPPRCAAACAPCARSPAAAARWPACSPCRQRESRSHHSWPRLATQKFHLESGPVLRRLACTSLSRRRGSLLTHARNPQRRP